MAYINEIIAMGQFLKKPNPKETNEAFKIKVYLINKTLYKDIFW